MAKHRTGKTFKGCCIMCGWSTLRGQGWSKKNEGRKSLLGQFESKKRRVKRNYIPDRESW